ncbi:lipocalin Cav p 3.0101-like [Cricetulus griseus]|uniref:Lipocalin Cav p 3.0101-like n=1 Tax=Cricetulus griseus TaxID=10029 RepID=A0A9J7GMD8_CRIGR|nr:lipocalin Cav p 3.0101-like [Cricetulus griseus]XP_027288499.1 lipocalin Cav p 3.0101-like [Cricetulus griseus]
MAAKEIDMITDYGMLKLFFRHLECIRGCKEMILMFYGEVDEECEKFEIEAKQVFSKEFFCTYAGKHQFRILYVSSSIMVIFDYYLTPDENLIKVLFLVGKGDSVSGEEQQKFAELCDKMRIPKEKIRYMFEKDNDKIKNICNREFSMAIDSSI